MVTHASQDWGRGATSLADWFTVLLGPRASALLLIYVSRLLCFVGPGPGPGRGPALVVVIATTMAMAMVSHVY